MNKTETLIVIKKKLIADFGSTQKAAINFGRTQQALDNALAGNQKDIPQYLLDYANILTKTTFHKKIII